MLEEKIFDGSETILQDEDRIAALVKAERLEMN